jgi:hypothetical protein
MRRIKKRGTRNHPAVENHQSAREGQQSAVRNHQSARESQEADAKGGNRQGKDNGQLSLVNVQLPMTNDQ